MSDERAAAQHSPSSPDRQNSQPAAAGGGSSGSSGGGTSDAPPRRAAVLGSPIRHSLSPVLHQAAYTALGLTGWRYQAFDCDEAALPAFIAGLGPEWAGLSLTMPLKRAALAVADQVSALASAVGAANTLVFAQPAGLCRADNTDVAGLVGALREAGCQQIGTAVVLGAGGTAQAALAALRELGQRTPVVLVREVARTTELRATAGRLGVAPTIRGALPAIELPPAEVIISTLPPGAADTLRPQPAAAGTVVLDVGYTPWPTPFATAAQAAGCRVVSGLAMLLHQAAAQVELMTGRSAPLAAMRAALDTAVTTDRSRPTTQ